MKRSPVVIAALFLLLPSCNSSKLDAKDQALIELDKMIATGRDIRPKEEVDALIDFANKIKDINYRKNEEIINVFLRQNGSGENFVILEYWTSKYLASKVLFESTISGNSYEIDLDFHANTTGSINPIQTVLIPYNLIDSNIVSVFQHEDISVSLFIMNSTVSKILKGS